MMDEHDERGDEMRKTIGQCGAIRAARQGQPVSDEDIQAMIAAAPPMTDEAREEQRRSFAYGNAAISNARVTRAMVDAAAACLTTHEAKR